MDRFLKSRLNLVWIFLVFATFISFETSSVSELGARFVRIAVLVVACAKVMVVGWEFIELRRAPRLLKIPFLAWAAVTCLTLAALAWRG